MGQIFLTHWEERLPDGRWVMHRPGEEAALDGEVLKSAVPRGIVGVPVAAPAVAKPADEPARDVLDSPAAEAPERPLKTAKLEAWQDYARTVGVDPGTLTKAELIAKIGG